MPNLRNATIDLLNRQLANYISAKEFAEYKVYRLEQQHLHFNNPNFQKELLEFRAQIERCTIEINRTVSCIEWLQGLKTISQDQNKAA